MKKFILFTSLALTVTQSCASNAKKVSTMLPPAPASMTPPTPPMAHPAPTNVINTGMPVDPIKPPVVNMTPPVKNVVANGGAAAPMVKGSNSVVPEINLQMEMAKISQKVFGSFAPAELMQLGQALESSMNATLATKDFDKGINKMATAVEELAQSFGSNIQVNKDMNTKLKAAMATAVTEFDQLVRSGKIADLAGESYIARIIKSGLSGLQKGFGKATILADSPAAPSAPLAPSSSASAPKTLPGPVPAPKAKVAPVVAAPKSAAVIPMPAAKKA